MKGGFKMGKGFFGGNSEILFFIIVFLILFFGLGRFDFRDE
jgi:hypothetical protein